MKKIVVGLIAANAADYLTTVLGLKMGFVESNEIIANLTPFSFLIIKVTAVGSIILLLYALSKSESHMLRRLKIGISAGAVFATIVISAVSIHNLLLIIGYKEELLLKVVKGVLGLFNLGLQ